MNPETVECMGSKVNASSVNLRNEVRTNVVSKRQLCLNGCVCFVIYRNDFSFCSGSYSVWSKDSGQGCPGFFERGPKFDHLNVPAGQQ